MQTKDHRVLRLGDIEPQEVSELLATWGLQLNYQPGVTAAIPGSYWGDDEAGLKGVCLFAREDTPLHSILHETSHYICVDEGRRRALDTDADSDDAEENAVCYLQVLLSDRIVSMGRNRMFADMDAWGYSFRLGSSRAWFEQDANDALDWLLTHGVLACREDQHPRLRRR